MRSAGRMRSDPDPPEETLLERLRAAVSGLLRRISGDGPQQALPLSNYRGDTGPVVPYNERRVMLQRERRRQHSSLALVTILVLLVLVIGIFYGFAWFLGGSSSGESRGTPTAVPKPVTAQAAPSPNATVSVLPTAGPGGSVPSPSPSAGTLGPGGLPGPGPGTPDAGGQRTYVVKPGDTPGGIARQFNVPVDALMAANKITDPRALKVGDRLTVPPSPTPSLPR